MSIDDPAAAPEEKSVGSWKVGSIISMSDWANLKVPTCTTENKPERGWSWTPGSYFLSFFSDAA